MFSFSQYRNSSIHFRILYLNSTPIYKIEFQKQQQSNLWNLVYIINTDISTTPFLLLFPSTSSPISIKKNPKPQVLCCNFRLVLRQQIDQSKKSGMLLLNAAKRKIQGYWLKSSKTCKGTQKQSYAIKKWRLLLNSVFLRIKELKKEHFAENKWSMSWFYPTCFYQY